MIKLSSPFYSNEECEAVCRVLNSQVACMGEETMLFEQELSSFLQTNVLCVSSGTAALQLALQSIDIQPGDNILVPSFTFVATFQAIKALNAIPIPCDIDIQTCFLDRNDVEKRINKKTKAILPVLYAGIDIGISEIYNLAHTYNLHVIEDAAHSFGNLQITKRKGILCFSFDAIKNLSCTDGGAIACQDKNILERIQDARLLGIIGDTECRYKNQRSWDFDVQSQGWRYHMSNLCAAIGRTQLRKFSKLADNRKKIANLYLNELKNIPEIRLLPIDTNISVPHIFPIIINNNKRNELRNFLLQNNIGCGVQYKPNHLLTYFNLNYSLPNTEWIYDHILSIPLHPLLTEQEVEFIIEKIKQFFKVHQTIYHTLDR